MPAFTDYTFPSCNGKTQIHVRRCSPDGEVRGVVQLAHGIAEHVERYDGFAAFLAENGYVVVANDHLGHGQSIGSEEELGCLMEEGGWKRLVIDMHTLCEKTAAEFPGLPYFLFGHSMGSFLARTYLIAYPEGLTAAVICGTGQQSGALVRAGRAMGRLEIRRHGADYKSELLNKMAFGAYNKGIEPQRTPCDWLTRDDAVVDAYIADPHAGFVPSAGLFTEMMSGIAFISDRKNLARMKKDLPLLFIAGEKDPVGEFGKGVKRAYAAFLAAGMSDVTLKLYPDCRHEVLNELCRDQVMSDVLAWFEQKR